MVDDNGSDLNCYDKRGDAAKEILSKHPLLSYGEQR